MKASKNNDCFYLYIKEYLVSWCGILQTLTYSSITSYSSNSYSYGFCFHVQRGFFNTQSYTGTRKCFSENWYFPVLSWLPESSTQCRDGLFWAEIYYHRLCVSVSLLSALLTPLFSFFLCFCSDTHSFSPTISYMLSLGQTHIYMHSTYIHRQSNTVIHASLVPHKNP